MLRRQKLYDQHGGEGLRASMNEARAEHTRLLAMQQEFWRQKSAIKWLQQGVANTAYFHAVVRQRRNMNHIGILEGILNIQASAIEYFSSWFGHSDEVLLFQGLSFLVPTIS